MATVINVGVAQIEISTNPDVVLRTILGSCVGLCIYDRIKKAGGLAHILLPNAISKERPEKYADTAVPMLIDRLLKEGCKMEFMSAKIAGGAAMFKFQSSISLGQIGMRNIEVVKQTLTSRGIVLVAEDIGGCSGRVIDLFLTDGRMKVKASGKEKIYYKV
jgi:chemotaxis protein CheD